MTEYIVLFQTAPGDGYDPLEKTYTAASDDAAIREAAAETSLSGSYAAVPARSWQPRGVTVEQKPAVTFAKNEAATERSSA